MRLKLINTSGLKFKKMVKKFCQKCGRSFKEKYGEQICPDCKVREFWKLKKEKLRLEREKNAKRNISNKSLIPKKGR